MVFQQPAFLWGLFLLSIPVVIHFLNFRKSKTVYFSTLRFIDEVNSTYRKRNQLTDLLLLILRLLIYGFVIVAFAQPIIPSKSGDLETDSKLIGLFVDNSRSMELANNGKSLLSEAKETAKKLISEYPTGTKFKLFFFGNEAASGGVTDKESAMALIESIQFSDAPKPLDHVLSFLSQKDPLTGQRSSSIILISDFQATLFSSKLNKSESDIDIFAFPIHSDTHLNISVDSCWFENPVSMTGQGNKLIVTVKNNTPQDYPDFPVRLIINDTLRNEEAVSLPAGSLSEVSLSFQTSSSGWQTGIVEISDFPVVFDNDLMFTYRIEPTIPVLLLSGNSEHQLLSRFFTGDSNFSFEHYQTSGFPRSDFNDFSLVILCGVKEIDIKLEPKIRNYLDSGGTVWFLPEIDGNLANYNSFLSSLNLPEYKGINNLRVESGIPEEQAEWLKEVVVNVDKRLRLPSFNKTLQISDASGEFSKILQTYSGDILISKHGIGSGTFVISGFPLDDQVTDLMYHPLFVPICYQIATISRRPSALYQVIGQDHPFPIISTNKRDPMIHLVHQGSRLEYIPKQQPGAGYETLLYPENLEETGLYYALSGLDSLAVVAFNHSREESDLTFLKDSILIQRFQEFGWNISTYKNTLSTGENSKIPQLTTPKKVWYLFLVMAFIGILVESFVLYRKK